MLCGPRVLVRRLLATDDDENDCDDDFNHEDVRLRCDLTCTPFFVLFPFSFRLLNTDGKSAFPPGPAACIQHKWHSLASLRA